MSNMLLALLVSVLSAQFVQICSAELDSRMADRVVKYGYPLEEYDITTEDGYIITIFRIPHGVNSTTAGIPLMLQHGLLCSSACWVINGPERALAMILADAGFDVWIPNNRGNYYGRKHVSLNPDTDIRKFWDFSFHEMGVYDMTATIDFIIEKTNASKVHYIGHSQGTTQFFAMSAARPEYNSKIKSMSALAPVSFLNYMEGALHYIAYLTNEIEDTTSILDIGELAPYSIVTRAAITACAASDITKEVCENLMFSYVGYDSALFDTNIFPEAAAVAPAGSSFKSIVHYGQFTSNGFKFRQFDYGYIENLLKYGSLEPPNYNLTNIDIPVHLYHAPNDFLSNPKDMEKLYAALPNATLYEVPFEKYNHIDFIWGLNATTLVYNTLIETLKLDS